MSKAGGGRGTNQHAIKGSSSRADGANSCNDTHAEADIELRAEDVTPFGESNDGQTPFDEDDRDALRDPYKNIRTRAELNSAEAAGIASAMAWLNDGQYERPSDLLDPLAIREIHRRMFANLWAWAGTFRTRETNLGVEPAQISHQVQILLGNAVWQIENDTHPHREVGVRLHKDLVTIHCFPNGNGRHSRLVADEIAHLLGLGRDFYSWGRKSWPTPAAARAAYLDAIRHTDRTGDYTPLIDFARS